MKKRNIDYVPISKLSRGYAGKIIDNMIKEDSTIYIMRNNEPTAVILSMKEYDAYLEYVNEKEKKYKEELIKELGGSLHEYADVSKIPLEDQAYTMHILEKYGKK